MARCGGGGPELWSGKFEWALHPCIRELHYSVTISLSLSLSLALCCTLYFLYVTILPCDDGIFYLNHSKTSDQIALVEDEITCRSCSSYFAVDRRSLRSAVRGARPPTTTKSVVSWCSRLRSRACWESMPTVSFRHLGLSNYRKKYFDLFVFFLFTVT